MTRGKSICNVLKSIRKQIADANGIHYAPKPCGFKGECRGTCPACEAEVKYIERELNMRRMAGKAVTVLGLSVGMVSLTACHDTPKTIAPKVHVETSGNVDTVYKHERDLVGKIKIVPPESANDSLPYPVIKMDEEVLPSSRKPIKRKKKHTCDEAIVKDEETNDHMLVGKISNVEPTNAQEDTAKVFFVVEVMPSFPGGKEAMHKYLMENIHWPETEECAQGRVVVGFIVERDGSLSDIKLVRSVTPGFDKEALRIVKSMPKWIPGTQNGKVVRVRRYLPINFKLE